MQKKLTKHGNSLALVIEKPILDLIGADADTLFEITTDGRRLVLSPGTNPERQKAVREALEWTNKRFAEDLKRLAE